MKPKTIIKRLKSLPLGGESISAVACLGYDVYCKNMSTFYDLIYTNYFQGDIIHIAEELESLLQSDLNEEDMSKIVEMAKNLKYKTFEY